MYLLLGPPPYSGICTVNHRLSFELAASTVVKSGASAGKKPVAIKSRASAGVKERTMLYLYRGFRMSHAKSGEDWSTLKTHPIELIASN